MKKTFFTISVSLSLSTAAMAQGIVNWTGLIPSAITAQTNSTTYSSFVGGGSAFGGTIGNTPTSNPPSGASFYWALLYAPYTGSQLATPTTLGMLNSQGWMPTGLTGTNGGLGSGRIIAVNPSVTAPVPWAAGVTNSIMMAGWSANLGTTWTAVLNMLANALAISVSGNAFFGVSTTGYIAPFSNSDGSPGAIVFGANPVSNGLPIYSPDTQLYLVATPEPGTMGLAALGGFCLLLRRRN